MPYYTSSPSSRHHHPEMVKRLAAELKKPPKALPRRVKLPSKGKAQRNPVVIQEEQTLTRRLHVYVVWDSWEKVPESDRGTIILDAYEKARGEAAALKISVAMGVTVEEARSLGVV